MEKWRKIQNTAKSQLEQRGRKCALAPLLHVRRFTVSKIRHRCGIGETILVKIRPEKGQNAWLCLSEAFRGQAGAALFELCTSAGLHNIHNINNCVFGHLPQTESCIRPVRNMTNRVCLCLVIVHLVSLLSGCLVCGLNQTGSLPGPDTGGSGLWDFFGSSRSFSSCFRVLRCRASLNMGKA